MSSVSGLFTRRAFNIDSVAVGTTDNPAVSSMTIVMKGDENDLRRFQGQLLKLADVLEVRTLPYHGSVTRELMLVRVKASAATRVEIMSVVDAYEGKVVELTGETMLLEIHGNNRRISGAIQLLEKYGIEEMARTGQIALGFHQPDSQ